MTHIHNTARGRAEREMFALSKPDTIIPDLSGFSLHIVNVHIRCMVRDVLMRVNREFARVRKM